jgi:nucleoside-diphosphate-sugar epimerase
MIIGSGFIAKNFKKKIIFIKKYRIAIYASGVSNSKSINKNNFLRERRKIISYKNKINSLIFIYISTCSIFDPSRKNTAYVKHKLNMENVVKKNFNKFVIVRFPEVVGFNNNKNNLINFFYQKIINNSKFMLWMNSRRNIIDIDDAVKLCLNYIKKIKDYKKIKLEINIANTMYVSVVNIVNIIQKLTLKKAIYNKIVFGNLHWKIKPLVSKRIIQMSSVIFNKYYLEKVLRKYYIFKK